MQQVVLQSDPREDQVTTEQEPDEVDNDVMGR